VAQLCADLDRHGFSAAWACLPAISARLCADLNRHGFSLILGRRSETACSRWWSRRKPWLPQPDQRRLARGCL